MLPEGPHRRGWADVVTIFLGPPGVGKGTQGVRLAEVEGWAHVSTGDLLRAARREGTELGRKAALHAQDLLAMLHD